MNFVIAGVMELADVVDSKSTGSDTVPVRVRSPAPIIVLTTDPVVSTFCLSRLGVLVSPKYLCFVLNTRCLQN